MFPHPFNSWRKTPSTDDNTNQDEAVSAGVCSSSRSSSSSSSLLVVAAPRSSDLLLVVAVSIVEVEADVDTVGIPLTCVGLPIINMVHRRTA